MLIVARGGGSLEDLWAFNEEIVVRAVAASDIPVISAVGHETDTTLIDFASDRRAPTPTAAAEMVSPSRAELLGRLAECARGVSREMRRRLEYAMQAVDALSRRVLHPAERLRSSLQLIGQLSARLSFGFAHRMHGYRSDLGRLQVALSSIDPSAVLSRGYSITRNAAGEVLRDASNATEGEELTTTLARGAVRSKVIRTS